MIRALQRMLEVARKAAAVAEPEAVPIVAGVTGIVLDERTYTAALDEWSEIHDWRVQGLGDSFVILSCNGPVRLVRAASIGL